jgi:uncharacterized protein YbgA (DUF1722 family)
MLRLKEKLVQMFFVKSNESKISIVIEMVQSTHIQYITNYFIKFCNYLNHFKSIFALCNILLHVLFYQKYIFQSFNINKKCSFL